MSQSTWGTLSSKKIGGLKILYAKIARTLTKKYMDFIEEFINLGHKEKVPNSDLVSPRDLIKFLSSLRL